MNDDTRDEFDTTISLDAPVIHMRRVDPLRTPQSGDLLVIRDAEGNETHGILVEGPDGKFGWQRDPDTPD